MVIDVIIDRNFNGFTNGCLWTGQRVSNVPFFLSSNSVQEDGYYHEYCRLYLANIALTNQVKDLIEDKNQLINRLSKYEVTTTSIRMTNSQATVIVITKRASVCVGMLMKLRDIINVLWKHAENHMEAKAASTNTISLNILKSTLPCRTCSPTM